MNKQIKHKSYLAVIDYKDGDASLTFKVYWAESSIDGCDQYHKVEGPPAAHTTDIELAEINFSGHVKWDGCCEFVFDDTMHFCDRELLENFTSLLHLIHEEAGKIIENADPDEFKINH